MATLPAAATPYAATIQSAASANGVDPALLAGLLQQESGFNANAVSPAGAVGIAQFMPATAAGFGLNPWDPTASINAAAKYLAGLKKEFGSDQLALAAYNAGAGNVEKYGGIPPFTETQNYVANVIAIAKGYGYNPLPGPLQPGNPAFGNPAVAAQSPENSGTAVVGPAFVAKTGISLAPVDWQAFIGDFGRSFLIGSLGLALIAGGFVWLAAPAAAGATKTVAKVAA